MIFFFEVLIKDRLWPVKMAGLQPKLAPPTGGDTPLSLVLTWSCCWAAGPTLWLAACLWPTGCWNVENFFLCSTSSKLRNCRPCPDSFCRCSNLAAFFNLGTSTREDGAGQDSASSVYTTHCHVCFHVLAQLYYLVFGIVKTLLFALIWMWMVNGEKTEQLRRNISFHCPTTNLVLVKSQNAAKQNLSTASDTGACVCVSFLGRVEHGVKNKSQQQWQQQQQ